MIDHTVRPQIYASRNWVTTANAVWVTRTSSVFSSLIILNFVPQENCLARTVLKPAARKIAGDRRVHVM